MKSKSTTTYPKVWISSLTFRIIILALVATMAAACGLGGIKDEIKDAKEQTIRVLDDAIRSLNNVSADWQVVLQDSIDKLTDETQSTIRSGLSVQQRVLIPLEITIILGTGFRVCNCR